MCVVYYTPYFMPEIITIDNIGEKKMNNKRTVSRRKKRDKLLRWKIVFVDDTDSERDDNTYNKLTTIKNKNQSV